jgi:hypothetical protein
MMSVITFHEANDPKGVAPFPNGAKRKIRTANRKMML